MADAYEGGTVEGAVAVVEKGGRSVNGNPWWEVWFVTGQRFETRPDSQVGLTDVSSWEGQVMLFSLDVDGRIWKAETVAS